eukprot:UN25160
MFLAGHTSDSAHLQSSMGYGRVFQNCTLLMVLIAYVSYIRAVVPGAIGAGRQDRIALYFVRSVILMFICIIPSFVIQIFSKQIMVAFGVVVEISKDVGVYCYWMLIASVFRIINLNIQSILQALDYNQIVAVINFITGFIIDMGFSYVFIYKLDYGIFGVALAQIGVNVIACLLCLVALCYTHNWD